MVGRVFKNRCVRRLLAGRSRVFARSPIVFVHVLASMATATGGLLPVDALHYDLVLDINPGAQWIEGSNTITVEVCNEEVDVFHFRLDDVLTITDILLNDLPVSWQRLESPVVEVVLDRSYQAGEQFMVKICYEGTPVGNDCLDFGCRGMRFQNTPPRSEYTISTANQPWLAYHWLPGVDDNRDKTVARIDVTVPDPLIVASNGLLTLSEPVGEGKTRYVWETNYPTVDSLYTICATDYIVFTADWVHETGTMPVQFYIWPEDDTPIHREVLLINLQMLDVFSELFGPYPFKEEKYGMAQYGYSNLLEHQTLTCFKSFPPDPHNMEDVLAHELAHQWWGDMVTPATWSDMWLSEGFATYGQVLWDAHKPDAQPFALKWGMYTHHPIDMHGTVYLDPEDINFWDHVYTVNVYGKGAWVLHMLRYVVGEEKFFAILHEYRTRYAYRSADTSQFVEVAEDVTGMDLDWFFDQWLYEEGFPDYECSLRELQLGDQWYAEIYVRQVQPAPYITFQCPVEFGDWTNDRRYVFYNDEPEEHILIPIDGPIGNAVLDPDWWLLHLGSGLQNEFVEGPPKVVFLVPEPNSLCQPDTVQAIEIGLHKDVVVEPIDVEVFRDGGGTIPFEFSYDRQDFTVTLEFEAPLAHGVYHVVLDDAVTDVVAGLALDGELATGLWDPLLPSGDGLPGGRVSFTFAVRSGVAGDLDHDADVDLADFGILSACITGPSLPVEANCKVGDLDGDGDVDAKDFVYLQMSFES